ncbi:dolichyl-phosphate-mannose--protein mannosyltransferase [Microbacterium sediminis]|uniref:Polyprenol-phosphate-mannose--protein mannosyltransferase n=1 Tax=Microbacterium sediminis TaxID=904291 RepID=A0A1B9NCV8_9MICO|nr:phospholipid carrier-dependent glycosyltransferase [Microbacterium sediminis]OCG74384.1 dolichyl-phosphate-mannose--protein mannosyltransferase [Microbacterium sediminis]QBR73754.1 phospholipid carrier-dependent glycosyltransferase [Microbacterium sediminis]
MRIRARAWEWLAPLLLTVIAALPRLIALQHPHELVFDETYYVKDAWSLWNLGYEGTWPDDGDARFVAGETGAFSSDPSYVVHPPLGKWLIALGMALFGADSGWGWRFAVALAGIAAVPVLYAIGRRVSGSIAVGAVAGGLLAVDGLGISMSRVALLDNFLALFVLIAVLFVVIDRTQVRKRIESAPDSVFGPVLWRRPWVLAAGVALGAATAVKWSGLYALAGVGLWLVATDALERRRAGFEGWLPSAIVRQGPASFVLLVPIAAVTYLASWSGWLFTAGGYDRQSDPNPLIALWNYHSSVYGFHVGLTSGHPYASPAWQWPLLQRPTAMWVDHPAVGEATCAWSDDCMGVITSLPNPIAWYPGIAAIVFLAVVAVRTRSARFTVPLAGFAITWVPWLLYPQRTTFQFYSIALLPYVCLAVALALQWLCRDREPVLLPDPTPRERVDAARYAARQTRAWRMVSSGFVVIALASALYFLPLSTGILEPYRLWWLHMWLPGWI